jgi:predicted cupin superfamily sugar epimerase
MKIDQHSLIKTLGLKPHPEGGFYAETYRSSDHIPANIFNGRYGGPRSVCTAIYYLVTAGNFSAFHRIKSDEIWHFYAGQPLDLHLLSGGLHQQIKIGNQMERGELPQYVVPAGTWFASGPAEGSQYSLLGCTVSPGFDFSDFELADRDQLTKEYPQHAEVIAKFTR